MFKIIFIGFIVLCIVGWCPFIGKLVITAIGFYIHPILGGFITYAYISDWINTIRGKKKPKQEETKQKQYHQQKSNNEKQQYQQYKTNNDNQKQYQQRPKQNTNTNKSYFTGCNTKDEIKKRHRELCKKYHPDRGGNEEIFKKMQAEYEKLMKCNL